MPRIRTQKHRNRKNRSKRIDISIQQEMKTSEEEESDHGSSLAYINHPLSCIDSCNSDHLSYTTTKDIAVSTFEQIVVDCILGEIFSFLYTSSWFKVLRVCKRWYKVGSIAFDPDKIRTEAWNRVVCKGSSLLSLERLIKDKRIAIFHVDGKPSSVLPTYFSDGMDTSPLWKAFNEGNANAVKRLIDCYLEEGLPLEECKKQMLDLCSDTTNDIMLRTLLEHPNLRIFEDVDNPQTGTPSPFFRRVIRRFEVDMEAYKQYQQQQQQDKENSSLNRKHQYQLPSSNQQNDTGATSVFSENGNSFLVSKVESSWFPFSVGKRKQIPISKTTTNQHLPQMIESEFNPLYSVRNVPSDVCEKDNYDAPCSENYLCDISFFCNTLYNVCSNGSMACFQAMENHFMWNSLRNDCFISTISSCVITALRKNYDTLLRYILDNYGQYLTSMKVPIPCTCRHISDPKKKAFHEPVFSISFAGATCHYTTLKTFLRHKTMRDVPMDRILSNLLETHGGLQEIYEGSRNGGIGLSSTSSSRHPDGNGIFWSDEQESLMIYSDPTQILDQDSVTKTTSSSVVSPFGTEDLLDENGKPIVGKQRSSLSMNTLSKADIRNIVRSRKKKKQQANKKSSRHHKGIIHSDKKIGYATRSTTYDDDDGKHKSLYCHEDNQTRNAPLCDDYETRKQQLLSLQGFEANELPIYENNDEHLISKTQICRERKIEFILRNCVYDKDNITTNIHTGKPVSIEEILLDESNTNLKKSGLLGLLVSHRVPGIIPTKVHLLKEIHAGVSLYNVTCLIRDPRVDVSGEDVIDAIISSNDRFTYYGSAFLIRCLLKRRRKDFDPTICQNKLLRALCAKGYKRDLPPLLTYYYRKTRKQYKILLLSTEEADTTIQLDDAENNLHHVLCYSYWIACMDIDWKLWDVLKTISDPASCGDLVGVSLYVLVGNPIWLPNPQTKMNHLQSFYNSHFRNTDDETLLYGLVCYKLASWNLTNENVERVRKNCIEFLSHVLDSTTYKIQDLKDALSIAKDQSNFECIRILERHIMLRETTDTTHHRDCGSSIHKDTSCDNTTESHSKRLKDATDLCVKIQQDLVRLGSDPQSHFRVRYEEIYDHLLLPKETIHPPAVTKCESKYSSSMLQ